MILAIVQARMNSSRLPGKVLLDLMGKPVLQHIVDRIRKSKRIDAVAIATTDSPADDELAVFVQERLKCGIFRGLEHDVLSRFYYCALKFPCHWVVRVTADDPLKDPEIIDAAIDKVFSAPGLDYCSNTLIPTYPEGLDIEVFSITALERAFKNAGLPSEREHVTPYIWKHPELFKIISLESTENLSMWRWTLDKLEDFKLIKIIYEQFYKGDSYFPYTQIVDFVKQHPHLQTLNAGIPRNEGYSKSLLREAL